MVWCFPQERKLRERSEEYCRQLQSEVRTRSTSDFGSSSSLGLSSDASRLEVERLEVSVQTRASRVPANIIHLLFLYLQSQIQYTEKLNQHQSRYNVELATLREQLQEAETHRDMFQREVSEPPQTADPRVLKAIFPQFPVQLQQAREKLDTSRMESLTDSEETIAELRKRHEREMKMLSDDNRKLLADLEVLSENNRRMQTERMQMDSDYEELR